MTTIEIMIELVRAAVLEKSPLLFGKSSINWDELLEESSKHGVLALVWNGITRLPQDYQPPRIARINFAMSSQEIWDRHEKQKFVLSELVEQSEKHNMRLLLLKGIGLSELYPHPQSRPSGDVDIYLFGDYEKGNLLFATNGFQESNLHSEFNYKGVEIENHKIPIFPNTKIKQKVSYFLMDNLQNVDKTDFGYYVFKPLINLPYLMMHALNHVNYNSNTGLIPFRHIVDFALFISRYRDELPPTEVFRIMKQVGLIYSFELFVFLSELFLNREFVEYHLDIMSKKDKDYLEEFLLKKCLCQPTLRDGSIVKQSKALWNRTFQLRRIARYIPEKPGFGLIEQSLSFQKTIFSSIKNSRNKMI